ncbi:hypothetical protein LTR28_001068, partial [Elasticomyces elasticus]
MRASFKIYMYYTWGHAEDGQVEKESNSRTQERINMAKDTMKAVIFKGPKKVAIEDRPIPKIKEPGDIIVKVQYTALCGSELHVFRGHQPSPTDFIMGHEFTGYVTEVGSDVKSFKKGDLIVTPFT